MRDSRFSSRGCGLSLLCAPGFKPDTSRGLSPSSSRVVLLFSTVVRHCLALLSDGWQACVGSSPGGSGCGTRQAELWGLLRQRFSSQRSRMMARCEATGWGRAVRSPLVSQLGLVCPGGVALTELLLVATPTGEDILGIIKHRGKSLRDNFCQC
jgi:hypothetical protein